MNEGRRSAGLSPAALTLSAVALVLTAGCGQSGTGAPDPTHLPLLSLGTPTLEIGTLDGPEPYTFAALESVLRLPDGRIAVSDAGETVIEIFEASGEHVRSWGRKGDGPGEFNNLSRLYPFGPDSLLAAERYPGLLTAFDLDGNPGRQIAGPDLSGDSTFTLDSWLYRRFWVEGALTEGERANARSTLDRLPAPTEAPGYRMVSTGDDGSLWIKEPAPAADGYLWTRVDASGAAVSVLSIPASFTPTHFRSDEVLGIWRGEADVHFVRAYSFAADGGTEPAPSWLTSERDAPPTGLTPPDMEAVMEGVRASVRQMASAQEIHYSTQMSYSDAIEALTAFEKPDDLWVDIIRGDPRGWSGVFAHPELDRVCGLAYGFGNAPGWTPGFVMCAPDARGPG